MNNGAMLPIRPAPIGIGTPDIESLTGYVQRIAQDNHLPVGPFLGALWAMRSSKVLRNRQVVQQWERADWDSLHVGSLAAVTGQSSETLIRLSFAHIHRLLSNWTCYRDQELPIDKFFYLHSSYPRIMRHRRFCPLCLKEQPYYRLKWQFKRVQACRRHALLIEDTCPRCHLRLRSLSAVSHLGRCHRCFFVLSNGTPRAACQDDLFLQERVDNDLDILLIGHLPLSSSTPQYNYTVRPDFGRRLEAMLRQRKWPIRPCDMNDYYFDLLEQGERGIDFSAILGYTSRFCGSLREFIDAQVDDTGITSTRANSPLRRRPTSKRYVVPTTSAGSYGI